MIQDIFIKQAELLLKILPLIDRESDFAIKGGTAINFFIHDLFRISVDIDLVYLPVQERIKSLQNISAGLTRLSLSISKLIPGSKPSLIKNLNHQIVSRLYVQLNDSMVKIEPNTILRGSVFPTIRKSIVQKAKSIFNVYAENQILSENELYAGKICAALDRQHPRDLFDISILFRKGGFNTDLKKSFIVYLLSHNRPIIELLNPKFINIRSIFNSEFLGMVSEDVTCEELENTRIELVNVINKALTERDRQFIISFKEGNPMWELLGVDGIQNMPAIKWKLYNISKMNPLKHKEMVNKLRQFLGI